jgi:hypothetical protein
MDELLIFSSDPTARIFCFSSIVFLLLYGAGFAFLQRWSRTAGRTLAIHRHAISSLGAALLAMAVGFGLYTVNVTMASARGRSAMTSSISPQELNRSIEMKSLSDVRGPDVRFPESRLRYRGIASLNRLPALASATGGCSALN